MSTRRTLTLPIGDDAESDSTSQFESQLIVDVADSVNKNVAGWRLDGHSKGKL